MARRFTGSHGLYYGGTVPALAAPYTLDGWLWADSGGADRWLAYGGGAYDANQLYSYVGYDNLYIGLNGGFSISRSVPVGRWFYWALVAESSSAWRLHVDGAESTGSGTLGSHAAGTVAIGRNMDGNAWFSGRIGDLAVWYGAALSDAEVRARRAGAPACAIRPGKLGCWWRLDGHLGPERDLIRGAVAVPTGTGAIVPVPGPPIRQPLRRHAYRTAAAGTPRSLGAVLDAAIEAARSAVPQLDAAIQAARLAQGLLDAGILRALSLAAALDAQVQIPTAAAMALDGAIRSARAASAGLDTAVSALRTGAAGLDAGVALPASLAAGIEAALQAAQVSAAGLDAAIVRVLGAAVGLDAAILASLLAVGLDALVEIPGVGALPADIWLAEIAAAIDGLGTLATHRYSSGPGYNHASAPGYYAPRIVEPMNFRRDLFAADTIGGRSAAGAGELVLANPDGALDPLLEQGLDGRDLTIKLTARDGLYGAALTVLRGTMQQAEGSLADLRLKIRDRQQELEVPIALNRYGGSNESGAGVDGGPELKDKPKPRIFGEVFNIEPVAVNSSLLIYQLHDGWIEAVTAVRDKGVALDPGVARTTAASLMASAPAPGTYDWCLGAAGDGAFIRLGSAPAGGVRADVRGDKRGGVYRTSVADLAAELAETYGGIAPGDLASADIAALNAKNAAAVGLHVGAELSVAAALDQLCRSIGAWWGFDRLGRFRVGRLEAPAGAPALTLLSFGGGQPTGAGDADLLELERLAAADTALAVPAWQVTLGFRRNWAPQSADELAGALDDEMRATLSAADQRAVAEDESVKVKHRLAAAPAIETLLVAREAAEAEAQRQLALLKVRRARYRCRIKAEANYIEALELAAPVALKAPRFGLDAGALLVTVGLDYAPAQGFLDLTLWG